MASCARRAATTSACETLLVPRIVIAAMLLSISDPDFYPDSAPEYGNPALDIQSRSRFQPSLAQYPKHMGRARDTPYLPIAHSPRLASLIGHDTVGNELDFFPAMLSTGRAH